MSVSDSDDEPPPLVYEDSSSDSEYEVDLEVASFVPYMIARLATVSFLNDVPYLPPSFLPPSQPLFSSPFSQDSDVSSDSSLSETEDADDLPAPVIPGR